MNLIEYYVNNYTYNGGENVTRSVKYERSYIQIYFVLCRYPRNSRFQYCHRASTLFCSDHRQQYREYQIIQMQSWMVTPIIANKIYLSSGVPASTVFPASNDYKTRQATDIHTGVRGRFLWYAAAILIPRAYISPMLSVKLHNIIHPR